MTKQIAEILLLQARASHESLLRVHRLYKSSPASNLTRLRQLEEALTHASKTVFGLELIVAGF